MANKRYNITYKRAGKAARIMSVMLFLCLLRSFACAISDGARFICKHYITAIILIILYGWMLVSLMEARAERDRSSETAWHYQQRNESLELLVRQ